MKRLFLLVLIIPFMFNSCEEDVDNQNDDLNPTNSILGTWKVESHTNTEYMGYIDPVTNSEIITDTDVFSGFPEGDEVYHTFGDNNTVITHYYSDNVIDDIDTLYYTLNGNEIVFEDMEVIYTIVELTNTTLDYEFLRETYYNGGGDTTLFTRLVGVGSYSSSSIPQ